MIIKTPNKKNLNSFDKQAHLYAQSSLIQSQVIEILLRSLELTSIHRAIDIGCGSGSVAVQLDGLGLQIEDFYGLDISQEMLHHHPKKMKNISNVTLICEDFEAFIFEKYDVIFAASSLQWARNLEVLLSKLAKSSPVVRFAIHTDKSLDSVHRFLGTSSPLRSAECLKDILEKYFEGKIWIEKLERNFSSREEFLSHLKGSGLLGGGVLNYSQAKYFRNNIPYQKAEYEVLMFAGISKLF